ncbi:chitooligosaccharide deacetylase [Paenibacillus yonginensis]|uniref:Chitooligosaccharide deacetylase n=1 Tax=Paenibacillus yonginensis TaxID=1462996 RepID=A0A1B1MZK9_9BACL|nr:polysaccharide deacetylase family protein [Paenibacillus yonginensis]ANS74599.1 chitooligosaccharide deacetylase [Paenibacillus yonginensis]
MPNRTRYKAIMLLMLLCFIAVPVSGQEPSKEPKQKQDAPSFHQNEVHTLSLSELRRKYADTFKFKGSRAAKQIALTFDDVPDPRFTPQVLKVLKEKQVKATFFVVGSRAKKHPGLIRIIQKQGHAIGNHSYSHPVLKNLSMREFKLEIERTEYVLEQITGKKPLLIRPPYGEVNEEQVRWARHGRYKIVNWNVDSQDWKGISKEEVIRNVLDHAGPGSIILQHAGGGVGSDLSGTIEALPVIIDELKARGYRFVTVPELLHTPEYRASKASMPYPFRL